MTESVPEFPSVWRWSARAVCHQASRVALLGNFDGVHLGHQELLKEAHAHCASGEAPSLLSFYPHPAVVFGTQVQQVNTFRQKARLLRQYGCSSICLFHFCAEFAGLSAGDFLEILVKKIGVRILLVGPDASVGKGRAVGVQEISTLMHGLGARLIVVPFATGPLGRISSTAIRCAVSEGRLEDARSMMGRGFSLEGPVRTGQQRGRKLGYPTLNIKPGRAVLPPDGVYATCVLAGQRRLAAVTNIGNRPTFGGGARVVETFLLDGVPEQGGPRRVEIELQAFLRKEIAFDSAESLKRQIGRDIEHAREILRG